MASNAALFMLVVALGCAGFLFGAIYLVFHLFGWFGRGVVGLVRPGSHESVEGSSRRVAECAACGHNENRRGAQFCSQCGARLQPIRSVEQHER